MKYYQSPRWSGEYLDCSMPMTFDTYNKCSYNCLYCFSYFQKSHSNSPKKQIDSHKDYQQDELVWVDVEKVKKTFRLERDSQFKDYIKAKRVMQWGGLADQFDNYEKQTGKTLELLKFFDEIDYPLSFSTKATWFTKDERYMSIIRKHKNWHFKVSIINYDDKKAKVMEKGVDSPSERLEGLRRLSEAGCYTTLRLRPFIIGYTNYNNEHLRLIEKAKEVGCYSVSTEFFCLEQRADKHLMNRYNQMSKIIGFDIYKFYKNNSLKRGYLRLNYNIKEKYINEMKSKCDELGLKFYVSDAHHKEKCNNGSCCGLPESFNYSRGQFTEALLIAKNNGQVRFSDISKHILGFDKFKWSIAEGLNTGSNEKRLVYGNTTLYEVMRNTWNDPNSANSPYKYFSGILQPIGLDENKDIIYKYVKK